MIIRFLKTIWELLKDKRVRLSTKLIYIFSVGLYVIAPVVPYLPFDDLFVFIVGSLVFLKIARKEAGYSKDSINKKRDKGAIDVEGKIVEDE